MNLQEDPGDRRVGLSMKAKALLRTDLLSNEMVKYNGMYRMYRNITINQRSFSLMWSECIIEFNNESGLGLNVGDIKSCIFKTQHNS